MTPLTVAYSAGLVITTDGLVNLVTKPLYAEQEAPANVRSAAVEARKTSSQLGVRLVRCSRCAVAVADSSSLLQLSDVRELIAGPMGAYRRGRTRMWRLSSLYPWPYR